MPSTEPFCEHDDRERRPLRIVDYEAPQDVCPPCWRRACRLGLVEK